MIMTLCKLVYAAANKILPRSHANSAMLALAVRQPMLCLMPMYPISHDL